MNKYCSYSPTDNWVVTSRCNWGPQVVVATVANRSDRSSRSIVVVVVMVVVVLMPLLDAVNGVFAALVTVISQFLCAHAWATVPLLPDT